jgi:predicted transcriptional regulator
MTTTGTSAADEAGRRDALADRLFQSMIGSFELASVWLGLRLQLYEALRDQGPATVAELSERAGIDPRYAREWLEQQAVAGLLDVEDPAADAGTRRYRLPDAHAEVLFDADNPAHAGAAAHWIGSLAEVLQRVPGIYRARTALTIRATSAVVRPWTSRRSSLITSGRTKGITARLAGSAPTSSRATPQPTSRAPATAPSRAAGSRARASKPTTSPLAGPS